MPVFSFSAASMEAMMPLPPWRMPASRSTSGSKPSRMNSPSRTEKGGIVLQGPADDLCQILQRVQPCDQLPQVSALEGASCWQMAGR